MANFSETTHFQELGHQQPTKSVKTNIILLINEHTDERTDNTSS